MKILRLSPAVTLVPCGLEASNVVIAEVALPRLTRHRRHIQRSLEMMWMTLRMGLIRFD